MNNYTRSDIAASDAEILKAKGRDQNLSGALRKGKNVLAGAAGLGASMKIAPFLSEYLPLDLAMKGINKVAPQIGNFLKHGQKMGLTLESGLDYLKGQASKRQNLQEEEQDLKSKNPKEERNIVQQYSPELHNYLSQKIKSGEDPVRAGAAAFFENKNFEDIIEKIEKDHRTNWSELVQTIYGRSNPLQGIQGIKGLGPQKENQMQKSESGGSGSDALMSILKKIEQLKGQR